MFVIKPFEYCVEDEALRALWMEIAQKANFTSALSYMKGENLEFEIVDDKWGSPKFWQMAGEMKAIAKHFDYSVEAGFMPPLKIFDFELMSPGARRKLNEEVDEAFSIVECSTMPHCVCLQ